MILTPISASTASNDAVNFCVAVADQESKAPASILEVHDLSRPGQVEGHDHGYRDGRKRSVNVTDGTRVPMIEPLVAHRLRP